MGQHVGSPLSRSSGAPAGHEQPTEQRCEPEVVETDAGFAELFVNRWCILTPSKGADTKATKQQSTAEPELGTRGESGRAGPMKAADALAPRDERLRLRRIGCDAEDAAGKVGEEDRAVVAQTGRLEDADAHVRTRAGRDGGRPSGSC